LPSGQAHRLGDEIATIAQSCTRIHDGTFTACCFAVSLIPVVATNRGAPCCAETGAGFAGGGGPHPAVDAQPAASSAKAPCSNLSPFGGILVISFPFRVFKNLPDSTAHVLEEAINPLNRSDNPIY
jgi:hypothetical protein